MNGCTGGCVRGLTDGHHNTHGAESKPRTSLIRCLRGAQRAPSVAVGAADGAGGPWRRGPCSTASSAVKAPHRRERGRRTPKRQSELHVNTCARTRHAGRSACTRTFPNASVLCAHVLRTRTTYTHACVTHADTADPIRVCAHNMPHVHIPHWTYYG